MFDPDTARDALGLAKMAARGNRPGVVAFALSQVTQQSDERVALVLASLAILCANAYKRLAQDGDPVALMELQARFLAD